MNKQRILNKHLNGVEIANSNESMLNAMTEFAKKYHAEQLILSGVVEQSEQLLIFADFKDQWEHDNNNMDNNTIIVAEFVKKK